MITFKNFKLALIFISVLLIMSCSKSEIEDTLTDNRLGNTQWIHRVIGNMSGDVYKYEILEFNSINDFTIAESDLNEIKTNYLAKGKYIINGNKLICSYSIDSNDNKKELVLILDDEKNTIYSESSPSKIYVKQ